MCEGINITILKKHVTDDLIDHIYKMDSLGQITLEGKPVRLPGKSWLESIEEQDMFSHEFLSNTTTDIFGVPRKIDEAEIVAFAADSQLDDTQIADELSHFNAEIRVWFEACDGYNPYELLIFEDGDSIVYDVDIDNSGSFVLAEIIHLMRDYPPAEFKAVIVDMLQSTRFNAKANILNPLDEVLQKHKVAGVLSKIDEGEIGPKEAMKLIKEINKPVDKEFLVFIHGEYCDGQAFISRPDGEFGGDGYIELNDSCPICVGTYRSESAEDAIKEAAENLESSEEIFYAVQIQK